MKNNKKMMNSRSQAHVEMIISFVIFLGALIFIFMFINPLKENKQDNSIDEVQRIILKNINLEAGELSVIVNSTNDCYDIPNNGNKFVEIKDSDRKYTLYYNLTDIPAVQSCIAKPARNYTFGAYSKETFISYEKVLAFANNYNSDYSGLKSNFGLTKDFLFNFRDFNGNSITDMGVTKNIPTGVEVNAKEFPVRIINSSAGIRELILSMRSW